MSSFLNNNNKTKQSSKIDHRMANDTHTEICIIRLNRTTYDSYKGLFTIFLNILFFVGIVVVGLDFLGER